MKKKAYRGVSSKSLRGDLAATAETLVLKSSATKFGKASFRSLKRGQNLILSEVKCLGKHQR